MQRLQRHLPPCCDPAVPPLRGGAQKGARYFRRPEGHGRQFIRWASFQDPGLAARLHWLRGLHARVPHECLGDDRPPEGPRGQARGHVGVCDDRAQPGHALRSLHAQGLAVPAAAYGVLRRVRGLWRDALREAGHADVREAAHYRQRDGLQQHLGRHRGLGPLHERQGDGPRRGVGELFVRGQRRVRPRAVSRGEATAPPAQRPRQGGFGQRRGFDEHGAEGPARAVGGVLGGFRHHGKTRGRDRALVGSRKNESH
mmetsp:Transcript_107443/g.302330  ORF Transcript_107443/g.302330 Transcript_107443/m.302330 type:complete len:256 (+) Transcript_107443:2255-3022(+)